MKKWNKVESFSYNAKPAQSLSKTHTHTHRKKGLYPLTFSLISELTCRSEWIWLWWLAAGTTSSSSLFIPSSSLLSCVSTLWPTRCLASGSGYSCLLKPLFTPSSLNFFITQRGSCYVTETLYSLLRIKKKKKKMQQICGSATHSAWEVGRRSLRLSVTLDLTVGSRGRDLCIIFLSFLHTLPR